MYCNTFRLTDNGHQRLLASLPSHLRGLTGHALYVGLWALEGYPDKKTIAKILEREEPVQKGSIEYLFEALEVELQEDDYESFIRVAATAPTRYYVPRKASEWFTGRVEELKTLHALLKRNRAVSVWGLGGMGKTQTALAYCQKHKGAYKYVFWIGAGTDADVEQGYAAIASHLGLPGTALSQTERADAARLWLEKHSGWLLVLDNLDDPTPNTRYFPANPKGRVLITTRREQLNLPDPLAPFALPTLPPPDSLAFLLRRCRCEEAAPPERDAAQELALLLGHLPLAMEQAAAYIAHASNFGNYLGLYKKRGLPHLDRRTPGMNASQAVVATTWQINFQAIEAEARLTQTAAKYAPHLLRLGAFLAPDAIPFELIQRGAYAFCPELNELFAKAEDEAGAEEVYNEALEPLTRYSLAARQPEARTFRLHRLVQAVTREELGETERAVWQGRVIQAVSSAFPVPEFENWKLCERLLPHAVVVGERILQDNVMTAEAARLLDNTGRYLFEMGRYHLADAYHQSALRIRQEVLPKGHLHFAAGLNNLGLLRYKQERYEEAAAAFEEALAIRRQHLSDDHLDVTEIYSGLAEVHNCQNLYEQAKSLLLRALAITRQNRPDADKHHGNVLNNLALLYYRWQRSAEAEPYYLKALGVWRNCLPANHPDIATCAQNLAELYRNQQRWDEAEPFFEEALSIQEQIYPDGHSDTAITHHNLAKLYDATGRHSEAEYHFTQMLKVDRKALGESHPEIADDLKTLAGFYKRQGRSDEAVPLLREAAKILRKNVALNAGE